MRPVKYVDKLIQAGVLGEASLGVYADGVLPSLHVDYTTPSLGTSRRAAAGAADSGRAAGRLPRPCWVRGWRCKQSTSPVMFSARGSPVAEWRASSYIH
jgi:hypothetical protein